MATLGTKQAQNSGGSAAKKTPVGKPFQKGKSGNPGGRPPVPKDVKVALSKLTPYAVRRLTELLESPDEKVAIRAAEVVLERNLGKVVQPVSGPDGGPLTVVIQKLGAED